MGMLLAGCAQSKPTKSPGTLTTIQLPEPSRAIHLRATFDKDPAVYIGRFIPDGIKAEDIDENAATITSCSKFIKPRTVEANQNMDEMMYVSQQTKASLGIVPLANISAGQQAQQSVRVRYGIVRKIQSDIDPDGLMQCCRADPSQCTGTIIGEFLMGSGNVQQLSSEQDQVAANAVAPQGIDVGATSGSEKGWRTVNTFRDVYFAFLTSATPLSLTKSASTTLEADCSWCENVPRRLDGTYFCGISPDSPSEAQARDLAMRNARVQAVKFLSESVTSTSSTKESLLKGVLEDEQSVTAAAQGVAKHVKDEKWCKSQLVPTPDGQRYRAKVLAYIANADTQAAASQVEQVLQNQQSAGDKSKSHRKTK